MHPWDDFCGVGKYTHSDPFLLATTLYGHGLMPVQLLALAAPVILMSEKSKLLQLAHKMYSAVPSPGAMVPLMLLNVTPEIGLSKNKVSRQ